MGLGQIVILNGVPRAGKSSIAGAIQETLDGVWMNLGVDAYELATPQRYRPGIGLRPGGERPDLESIVPRLYAALYETIAAHSKLGLNVVTDVGHHGFYSKPLNILADCAQRLEGFPVLFVGVRCPLHEIMKRRSHSEPERDGQYLVGTVDDPVPLPVRRWQSAVHEPGIYDLEVDTSVLTPQECAQAIHERLDRRLCLVSAFEKIAAHIG